MTRDNKFMIRPSLSLSLNRFSRLALFPFLPPLLLPAARFVVLFFVAAVRFSSFVLSPRPFALAWSSRSLNDT